MPCWKFCDNVAGAGRWAWGGKKDFLEDVSVCVHLKEKLIGESLRGLRNTAWTTDTPTAKLPYFVCICVGAQDLFWGWTVDCFPSSVWEQAAACRRGRIWGLGLRLFSDWVRAHTGSSFLCREKTEEKKTEKRREDSVKTCQGESTQGMTEVRKAPTLSCEVTSDFYFFLIFFNFRQKELVGLFWRKNSVVTNLNSRKLYLNCSVFLSSTGLQLTGKRFSGQLGGLGY